MYLLIMDPAFFSDLGCQIGDFFCRENENYLNTYSIDTILWIWCPFWFFLFTFRFSNFNFLLPCHRFIFTLLNYIWFWTHRLLRKDSIHKISYFTWKRVYLFQLQVLYSILYSIYVIWFSDRAHGAGGGVVGEGGYLKPHPKFPIIKIASLGLSMKALPEFFHFPSVLHYFF